MPSAHYESQLDAVRLSRVRRGLFAAFMTVVILGAASGTAEAHTNLLDSSPKDGATLQRAPKNITLVFSDDIDPRFATVVMTVGNHREKLETNVEQGEVTADLPTEVDAGTPEAAAWKIAYRVVSADGHPVNGVIGFEAPAPPRPTPTQDSMSSAPTDTTATTEPIDDAELTSSSEEASSDGSPFIWVLVLGLGLILIVPALAWKFRRRPPS